MICLAQWIWTLTAHRNHLENFYDTPVPGSHPAEILTEMVWGRLPSLTVLNALGTSLHSRVKKAGVDHTSRG